MTPDCAIRGSLNIFAMTAGQCEKVFFEISYRHFGDELWRERRTIFEFKKYENWYEKRERRITFGSAVWCLSLFHRFGLSGEKQKIKSNAFDKDDGPPYQGEALSVTGRFFLLFPFFFVQLYSSSYRTFYKTILQSHSRLWWRLPNSYANLNLGGVSWCIL